MPTREEIDSFKQKVNLWGNEPAILEALGEAIEDVLPPEPTLEEELSTGELDQEDISMDDFLSQVGLDAENEVPEDDQDIPGLDDLLDEPPEPDSESIVPDTEIPDTDDFSLPDDLSDFGDLGLDTPLDDQPADDLMDDGLMDDGLSGDEEDTGIDDALAGLESFMESGEPVDSDGIDDLSDLSMDEVPDESEDIDEFSDDLVDSGEFGGLSADDGLEEFGDLSADDGLEEFGDLSADDGLEELGDIEDLSADDDLEELGDIEDFSADDDLEELGDIEDLSADDGLDELGDLEDLSSEDDLTAENDLEELGDPGDLSAGDDLEELGDLGDLSAGDDLEELGDLGDLSAGDDLEELGDLGEPGGSADPFNTEDEGFDLGAPGEEFDLSSPDEDISELGGMEDMSLDNDGDSAQFSLGDFGEEFNFQEGISFDDDMDASLDSLDTLDDTFLMEDSEDLESEEEDQFQISPEDMDAVQENLRRLPLNLKIAIQDILSEADDLTGVRYRKLVNMLIKGAAPRQVSTEFFNITGKKIELPRGYQKLTGREFESKQSGFLYQFAEKGWPFIRLVAVILILLGVTVYLSFHYLYRPLQAHIYYENGLEQIEEDNYVQGEEYFKKAYFGWNLGRLDIDGWPRKVRFIDYADAYLDRRAYPAAAVMYEGLIGEYPDYIKGYLEYGLFLSNKTGEYAHAADVLSMGLDRDMYNYNLMLALGDNYMLWSEEDPDRLEDARYEYATALSRYDGKDEIMLRMLSYFLKTEDHDNISILNNIYAKKNSIKGDTAFTALILSDLAGYYIDRDQVSDAKDLLYKAEQINVTVPDVHYQLSRYFNRTYNMDQEKTALQKALFYMDQTQPLSRSRIFKKIAIYRRRGEISYEEGEYGDAEVDFEAGIRLLEDSQERGLIGTDEQMGELYADMGNLHYEIYDDLGGALNYYTLAEKNQYFRGDMSYKKGYIYYDKQNYDKAVLEFESALKNMDSKRNTQFALANTLVRRQNLFGARNQYVEILRDLKREESSLPYLAPEDILEHRSLVNHFIRVYNNLAFVDFSLAGRSSDTAKQSQALLSLTKAADYADRLDRDPDTMIRTRPEDSLVFQNTMAMIKPIPGTNVHMYDEIPRTPDELLSR